MYLVKDIGGAIGLMAVALVLLGTWPVVLAVLERRGRLPQHTYLDYSITNFLAAVLIAFTFGQIGDDKPGTPNFLTQLTQDNWPSIMFAMAGGVVISLGTLATQYGWAFVGLSVTEVMASSLKVVIGTTLNYFLDGRINKAEILFPGVGCFLIAACLGSLVHSSNAADNQEKLSSCMVNHRNTTRNTANEELTKHLLEKEKPKDCEEAKPDVPQAIQAVEKIEAGTADFLVELEGKRSIKDLYRSILKDAGTSADNKFTSIALSNFIAGAAAGCTTLIIIYPLDIAHTRLAADVGRTDTRQFKGIRHFLQTIYKKNGIRGIYRGLPASLQGMVVHRGLYFGGFDTAKDVLVPLDSPLWQRWVTAQAVTSMAGLISYPLDTVRRRMMMQSGREVQMYGSTLDCWRKIYKLEGVKSFYRGALSNMFRSTGAAAILVLYDEVKKFMNRGRL